MALTVADPPLLGSDLPRLGIDIDPAPIAEIERHARIMGIELMPWQRYTLGVAEATDNGQYLFPEVCDVVARQNGKSTKLAPLIRYRISQGRRILHAAQDRIIPRRIYRMVAESFKKGEAKVRLANGQEEILLPNGGRYAIVAPQRGIRGNDADDLLLDEIREQEDWDFTFAARPTVAASSNGQILYMSNAGHEASVVLNDLKARAGKDPALAYLEWSAAPELDSGDRQGWAQANPALGRTIDLAYLERTYNSYRESGNLAGWETEHLCRWVLTMAPRLVDPNYWLRARRTLSKPLRPSLGISCHPTGSRASAAVSWAQGDGSIAVMVLADVSGNERGPVDLDRFGHDLRERADALGVVAVAFDPLTDAHLARYFNGTQPVSGQTFANASERFVRNVERGQLQWEWADQISEDLMYLSRKPLGHASFTAEPVDPRRPVTAALAAVRAHWLAAEPNVGAPSVY